MIYHYTVVKGRLDAAICFGGFMNSTLYRADLAQGHALLSRLPDCYFSILKSAQLEQRNACEIACTFEVPGWGKRSASATSSYEAIRLALIELASALNSPIFLESESTINSDREARMILDEKTERFQSKTRQLTIGVSMPTSLKRRFTELAESQGNSFAEVARKFAVLGFEDFEDRSLFVSSKSLFEILDREINEWQSSNCEQIMLRLDPGHAARVRTTAKEFGKSASEFGALCMAHGFAIQQQLVLLEAKVASCKGPAIRSLLMQVGLGSYAVSLLSGVLAGHVRAPKALLKRLANIFEASETLLATLFRRSFESRLVPSFKAENGKPEVSKRATPWETAVKSLKLPPDQTKELLDLGAKNT